MTWFRNLTLHTLPPGWSINPEELAELLAPQRFEPAGSLQPTSLGWVPPLEEHDSLVFAIDRQLLLALRMERKLLPAKVVAQALRERAAQIEAAEGFKPGRKRLRDLKDEVRDALMARAFSVSDDIRIWIDPVGGWLVIDSASVPRAAEALGLLLKSVEGLVARPLRTVASPTGEMTAWLEQGEPPPGFSIDQDAELRARDSKATVRYANQTLEREEVSRHTKSGKQCTKLALTWANRVSFVLTEKLDLRRVQPLDVLKEALGPLEGDPVERFTADMTLMTGELGKLLNDLVECLGGRQAAL